MAIDTFLAYVGVYGDVADAEADYELIKDLHTEVGLIDAYDAAVVERRAAIFPFAAIGGGILAATTGGGAILGAVAGHAAAGMSRSDLKDLGEQLDAGQAGLVVVAVSDMGAKVELAMKKAEKVEKKQIKADNAEIEKDAQEAESEAEQAKTSGS